MILYLLVLILFWRFIFMKRFGLKIGIDVDDVLFQCNEFAVNLANRDNDFEEPLKLEE